MTTTRSGPTLKEVMAARGRSFSSAAEAYEALTGETLSDEAAAEGLWYERLRRRMVAARKGRGRSQGDVARAMETSQSEVSRLENGFGPGTRLGTLRGYLAACDTTLEALIAVEGEAPAAELQEAAPQTVEVGTAARLAVEDEVFLGNEAVGIMESMHAINNLLRGVSIGRDQRKDMILGFLDELSHVRGGLTIPLLNLNVTIPLPKDAKAPDISVRKAAERAGGTQTETVSEERFRETIARPLDLSDF